MENEATNWTKKIGNLISAMILGNTREIIARIDERTKHVYEDLKSNIKPDLQNVRERLAALEGSLGKTYAGASPIKLLPKGEIILNDGLKKYLDDNKSTLLSSCKSGKKLKNPYDVQEAVFKFFDTYDFGEFETIIKSLAFSHGVGIETVRRIAGIYFRDICLAEHNFKPEDLDRPKPI